MLLLGCWLQAADAPTFLEFVWVEWRTAEHAPALETGVAYSAEKWGPRLDLMLGASRLCEILPGEAPPYPSCVQ